MATWPATLPAPALNTLTESPPKNAISTQMDKGPAKTRRRTTANVRPLKFSLKLTPAQTATLDTFFDVTTYSGVDEFNYTHPRTGAAVSARFKPDWVPDYKEAEGAVYICSIELEIMP